LASIRRHPNARSRWQVRYRDPTGRQRTKNVARKADAEKSAVTVEAGKLKGDWLDPELGKTTLGEWSARWLATTSHLKPKTRAGYESLLKCHVLPAFGDGPLNRIEPLDVRQWVARLDASGLSPSRVRQAHQLLSALLGPAAENGYLARNPCARTPLPRARQREKRFLDADQVARLGDAIDERYEALVYVLAYGGLRWAEAVALRRPRCQLLRSRLQIVESLSEVRGEFHLVAPKSGKGREVVLPSFVRDTLAASITAHVSDTDGLVFASPKGKPLRHSNFRRNIWLQATASAGLPTIDTRPIRWAMYPKRAAAASVIANSSTSGGAPTPSKGTREFTAPTFRSRQELSPAPGDPTRVSRVFLATDLSHRDKLEGEILDATDHRM
jgi:integrase